MSAFGPPLPDLRGRRRRTPEQRGPNYRRLSRYDVIGLIWLHGRPVVALTADRAVISTAGAE
jgi:hypothetical protein